jgi:hypothetical protein
MGSLATGARTRRLAVALVGIAFLVNDTGGVAGGVAGRTDDCGQWAYATKPARQHQTFVYALNVSSIPAYLDREDAIRAVREAAVTVTRARSDCPGTSRPRSSPRVIYGGPTLRSANVTPDSECFPSSNSDGINVVSFGRISWDVVAVTCSYTYRGDIWQSDVMLSDRPGVFTLTPGDGSCVASFDLQAVMTHERGHSFGLAHVPESLTSDQLTMSSLMGTCDGSGRSLGAGDVAGLAALY